MEKLAPVVAPPPQAKSAEVARWEEIAHAEEVNKAALEDHREAATAKYRDMIYVQPHVNGVMKPIAPAPSEPIPADAQSDTVEVETHA